uniref:glycoside hydrolase family 2 protein n=1 Tax=Eubacterium cellulosolvens TaxID=29322 RepID=UPI00048909EF|nr:glycoside hydrolase family 2 TIM barrel-domain containing protein [[Eubacterium] cellulosolvens]
MNNRIYLNNGWEFTENFTEAFLHGECDDGQICRDVRLPHTVKEIPYNYCDENAYQMISGYRRKIYAPKDWTGKKVFLTIGAAAHSAYVFVNGEHCGSHSCGYTAFSIDISSYLRMEEHNQIVIRVNSREDQNIPPFGYVIDYMTYGGIYREVWLEVKNPVNIRDVFVRADSDFYLNSEVSVDGDEEEGCLILRQKVLDLSGRIFDSFETELRKCRINERLCPDGSVQRSYRTESQVEHCRLWTQRQPKLYVLHTELVRSGEVLDTCDVRFGFRSAEFRRDGFYLNGKKVRLTGLNRHQSWPYVGYAMPESQQRLDADLLRRELGVNCVRTSHYPQSPHFYDRCDELGLLVFTEIPGWQHIGDDAWKKQAVKNTEEMVLQYRNHPSIILWGVRINESEDDDDFYRETNAVAHRLDPGRQTGGVRYLKKSHLLEDVYTFNDFSHSGANAGCEKKKSVTPDMQKAYLVSEHNGHMYPTKTFDSELHRSEHAIRHANVLNAVAGSPDVAGSFGWCMFDYNTHKDFGSGDRICYHGVMDMYRNPKPAAAVYAVHQSTKPVLEISSAMDIGEHPSGNPGKVYIFTNSDSVRMYKNGVFIREYSAKDSEWKNLRHGPILISDFIGDQLIRGENFSPAQSEAVKYILNYSAIYGMENLPPKVMMKGLKLIAAYHMKYDDAYQLYGKYIGNWGGESTEYRFEAIKNGEVVCTRTKAAVKEIFLSAEADHTDLVEGDTYDVASVRISMRDQNENIASFYQNAVTLHTEGPVEIIGPDVVTLRGGLGGTFIRTTGEIGDAALLIRSSQGGSREIRFTIQKGGRKE